MAATPPDPGLAALDAVYRGLGVDDRWVVRTERGFTWWSYRLAQHAEASEPFTYADGALACTLRVWTDVVRDTEADGLPSLLGAVNVSQTMSAVVSDDDAKTVVEAFTAVVFDDTIEAWTAAMVTAAVLQNTAAHARAHTLAEATGGTPWASAHPRSGERQEMDDILNVPAWIAETDSGPSAFRGELVEALDRFGPQVAIVGLGDSDTYTAEVVYSSAIPSIAAGPGTPQGTALFQVSTDQHHPQLGSGALVTLRLPRSFGPGQAADIAGQLNAAEAAGAGATTFMGAWCPSPAHDDELCFVSFLPSILAKPGVLENMFSYSAVRAQWAYELLEGD